MKKYFLMFNFILLLPTMNMAIIIENQTSQELTFKNCWLTLLPHEIRDLIASFLTFDDVESEEEFINRKKGPSCYPETFDSKKKSEIFLKDRVMPISWLQKHKAIGDNEYTMFF